MVSGNPKSTGIPQVDELSTRPLDLGCHKFGKLENGAICMSLVYMYF